MSRCFCPDSTDTVEGITLCPHCLRKERQKAIENTERLSKLDDNGVLKLLRACIEIEKLEEGHAEHIKGWKCGFFPDEDILKYAHLEISELEQTPDDITEMADSLICLLSYCIRKKWDLGMIGDAIRTKLRMRFKDVDKFLEDKNE